MRTIVVGYDGTRGAEAALGRVATFAKAFGSRVVVVSVASPEPVAPDGAFGLMPYYDLGAAAVDVRLDEALWQQHRARVESFFADSGTTVEFAGVIGSPVEEILEVAEQQHADLIVVGTGEPGFLERLLGGSVSQGIARRAHCDVLVVHVPPADEN
jgi:nucleotide-binding universal stress UspA family protein